MALKNCILILVSLTIFGCYAGTASAQVGYCSGVIVISAGANTNGKIVNLKNTRGDCGTWPINTQLWFYLDNTNTNASAMLAAAITAQTQNLTVTVMPKNQASNGTYTNWSSITQLSVNN